MSDAPEGARARAGVGEWVFMGLCTLAFVPAVRSLAIVWRETDYLSHGFMVPVVSLFLAAGRRDAWSALPAVRDPRGLALIAASLGLSGLGLLADYATLTGVAVVLAVCGAVWTLRGVAGLRVMAFPLAFLGFMVPLPTSVVGPVIVRLQLWVSVAAVEVLRAAGLAILRDGNVIVLPAGGALFVDEACSGITSVVTLVPLGVLLAWTTERRLGPRLVLLACVLPAAMLGNLVRVIATVWVASRHGVEVATSGFLHDWAGVFTYVLACGLLLGVARLQRALLGPSADGGEAA